MLLNIIIYQQIANNFIYFVYKLQNENCDKVILNVAFLRR